MTETGTELSISFISQHLPAAKVLQEGYLIRWGHVVYSQILAEKVEQKIHHFFSAINDIDDTFQCFMVYECPAGIFFATFEFVIEYALAL